MADQVTISTFLELKDNLTPGLAKVEAALKRMTQQAALMNGAMVKAAANVKSTDAGFKSVGTHLSKAVTQANTLAAAVKKIKVPAIPGAGGKAPGGTSAGAGGAADPQKGLFGTLVSANLAAAALTKAFTMAGDAAKFMFQTAIHYGVEYEKINTGIASALFTTHLAASMESGKAAAQGLMKTMHDISLTLPGQAQEYYEVFERSLPSAIAVGITDMKKYAGFISEYTAVAIKRNVGATKAATDIQMLLQGRARITTRMFQVLNNYIGMTQKEFNELMKTDRKRGVELLMKSVTQAASGMKGAAADAITVFGELQTRLQDIAIIGEKPLFLAAKETAVEINKWLKDNGTQVNNLVSVISTGLGDSLRGVAHYVTDILSGLMDIMGIAKTDTKKPRTAAVVQEELRSAWKNAITIDLPGQRIPLSPGKRGEIDRLTEELSKIKKEDIQMAAVQREFATLTTFAPIDVSKNVMEIARQSTERYKAGWFEGHGRPESEAFDVYLKSMGVDSDKRHSIWTEMIKMGAEKPLALASTETPEGRASNYQDFRYSRFDINQAFAEGFDPDRIAVAFATDLARVGEMRMQSMHTPTFTGQ